MSKEISVSVVNPMREEVAEDDTARRQKNGLRVKPLLLVLLVVVGAAVGFAIGVFVPINTAGDKKTTEEEQPVGDVGSGNGDGVGDGNDEGDGDEGYAGTGFQVVNQTAMDLLEASKSNNGRIACVTNEGSRARPMPLDLKKKMEDTFELFKQQYAGKGEEAQASVVVPKCSELLALEALDTSDWSPTQVILRDSLVEFAFSAVKDNENPYDSYIPIHGMSGPHQTYEYAVSIVDVSDIQYYVYVIERIGYWFSTTKSSMVTGLQLGYKAYKTTVLGALESISKIVDVANVEDLTLVKPLVDHLRGLGASAQAELDEVLVLAETLFQTIKDLRDYLVQTYLPAIEDAPVSIGERVPAAFKNMYEDRIIREYTNSKTASANDIHELGLQEVARIRSRMEAIALEETGSKDVDAFYASFATSEENGFRNVEDVISHCYEIMLRVTPKLPKFFVDIPVSPMTVVPIPNSTAQPGTTASYGGGTINMNANYYFILQRHLQAGIMVHEGYAGHHFHLSLCGQIEGMHPFLQRTSGQTSFVEGWGLYTERLGEEMDVYVDNRELFGRLQSEMLRACRLVVDTGLHAKGWTRQQAVDFMNKNFAALPEEVEFEVDRYISIPGQALAYKMGELSIIETRQAMETKFGALFDLRKFHSRLLSQCSMPVSTIKRFFRDWNPSN